MSPSLYDEVLMQAQRTQSTAEEAILQLGLMSEGELLKYIAGLYRTRFVGSDRLAKAGVDPALLQKVPRKLAKRLTAFPILYDNRSRTLSVVAADVTDDDVRQQMQFATGARDVKVYVAREAAIRAAIAKHYDQDGRPFEMLLSGASSRQVRTSRESDPVPGWGQVFEDKDGLLIQRARAQSIEMEQPANDQLPEPESEEPPPQTQSRVTAGQTLIEQLSAPTQGDDLTVDPKVYLETLSVLVTLIEQLNQDRGGHSMRVARICQQVGERIRLTKPQIQGILIAAYLHDVGVAADSHVTPFDVALDEAKREVARRSVHRAHPTSRVGDAAQDCRRCASPSLRALRRNGVPRTPQREEYSAGSSGTRGGRELHRTLRRARSTHLDVAFRPRTLVTRWTLTREPHLIRRWSTGCGTSSSMMG